MGRGRLGGKPSPMAGNSFRVFARVCEALRYSSGAAKANRSPTCPPATSITRKARPAATRSARPSRAGTSIRSSCVCMATHDTSGHVLLPVEVRPTRASGAVRLSTRGQREVEVDAVVGGRHVAAGQLLDPLQALAQRVDVDVQRGSAVGVAAAEVEERAQGRFERGAVLAV